MTDEFKSAMARLEQPPLKDETDWSRSQRPAFKAGRLMSRRITGEHRK